MKFKSTNISGWQISSNIELKLEAAEDFTQLSGKKHYLQLLLYVCLCVFSNTIPKEEHLQILTSGTNSGIDIHSMV